VARENPGRAPLNAAAAVAPQGRAAGGTGAPLSTGRTSLRRFGTGGAILTDAVHSEEEMNRVILALLQRERENPATRWMATLAVPPPMRAADPKTVAHHVFVPRNGRILGPHDAECGARDVRLLTAPPETPQPPHGGESERNAVVLVDGDCVWTRAEERIFVDKYVAYPKDFAKIASCLPFKSVSQVIAFYYLSKRRLQLRTARRLHEAALGGSSVSGKIVTRKAAGGLPPALPIAGGPGPSKRRRTIDDDDSADPTRVRDPPVDHQGTTRDPHSPNVGSVKEIAGDPRRAPKAAARSKDGKRPHRDPSGDGGPSAVNPQDADDPVHVAEQMHLMEQLLIASDVLPAAPPENSPA
jgi:hypothetical protein